MQAFIFENKVLNQSLIMKKLLENSWKSFLLELLVVFVGVYLAFELNNFSENQKVRNEKDKVMTSLKHELDVIGISFGDMGNYQKAIANEWDSLLRMDKITDFHNWRYIQPQYNYAVLEYAIDTRDTRIINFELYEKLIKIHREIKKLEFTENLMTEFGGKLRNIPQGIDTMNMEYKARRADNKFSFYKFTSYARDRGNILMSLPELAREALAIINQHFPATQRFAQEKEVLHIFIDRMGITQDTAAWNDLKTRASRHFTHITDQEWESFRAELLEEIEK